MSAITTQQCFTDDWRRTAPDLAVYLPQEPPYYAESVDMSLVDYTPGGDLLAVRTWLFLQNHDGFGYGGSGPMDLNSRRPQFLAVGEFREAAHQPVWFSEPLFFCDTQKVGLFPDYYYWLSMYASLTERDGKRIFWYTDRKLFFLGRYITDEMLAGLTVPT